jgi:hypothetical protein
MARVTEATGDFGFATHFDDGDSVGPQFEPQVSARPGSSSVEQSTELCDTERPEFKPNAWSV